MSNSLRRTQSAGQGTLLERLSNSPYQPRVQTANIVDRSSLIWTDFYCAVDKRKELIKKLSEAATESSTPITMLKQTLLDLRETSLTLIEDGLELEYRARIEDINKNMLNSGRKSSANDKKIKKYIKTPVPKYIRVLFEMINDVELLFSIPNIKVMLPANFPSKRNPFLLGRNIDEMSIINPPAPAKNDIQEELKVLELLRYKRASHTLLRAEVEVFNNLPIKLYELESIINKMPSEIIYEKIIRIVSTILDNDLLKDDEETDFQCLTSEHFTCEGFRLLKRLNSYKGNKPMRIDLIMTLKKDLEKLDLNHISNEPCLLFLIDWISLAIDRHSSGGATSGLSVGKSLTEYFQSQSVVLSDGNNNEKSLNFSNFFDGNFVDIKQESNNSGVMGFSRPSSQNYSRTGTANHSRAATASRDSRPNTSSLKNNNNIVISASTSTLLPPSSSSRNIKGQTSLILDPSKEKDELASEVDPNEDYVQTHENIYDPAKPKLKSKAYKPSILSQDHHMNASSTSLRNNSPPIKNKNKNISSINDTITNKTNSTLSEHLDEFEIKSNPKESTNQNSPSHKSNDLDNFSVNSLSKIGISKNKLKSEVEKVIKELGIFSKFDEEGPGPTQNETIESLRYELYKMQTELLRREVLDVRNYDVKSIDDITKSNRDKEISNFLNSNNSIKKSNKRKNLNINKDLVLFLTLYSNIIKITYQDKELILNASILVDLEFQLIKCSITISHIDAINFHFIDLINNNIENNNIDGNNHYELFSFNLTRLTFNRLTKYNYNKLIEVKRLTYPKYTEKIEGLILEYIKEVPLPSGKIIPRIDRNLYQTKVTQDNVLVNVLVMRNDNDDGLIFNCIPLAGIFGNETNGGMSPVLLFLPDNELEVLLFAQPGLFDQAITNWNSMTNVVKWLVSRLTIKKIYGDDLSKTFKNTMKITRNLEEQFKLTSNIDGKNENIIGDNNNNNSQYEFDEIASQTSQITTSIKGFDGQNSIHYLEVGENAMENTVVTGFQGNLAMLEVKIKRDIEFDSSLFDHWLTRNAPKMIGLQAILTLHQDLDVLIFTFNITVPSRRAYHKLITSENNKASANNDLIDFKDYEDDADEEYLSNEPTELVLQYKLTREEVIVFGQIDHNNEQNNTITTTKSSNFKDVHPENLLWNCLLRLKLNFKGNNVQPFKANDYSADNEDSWELEFNREILREVKTINENILMINVRMIGSDYIFDPLPVNISSNSRLVEKKILKLSDLRDLLHQEGWKISLLENKNRVELLKNVLDKLKVVDEGNKLKLELYTYVETKLLKIIKLAFGSSFQEELGSVEINSSTSLADLRILMKHELDNENVPQQFRFMYKNTQCSLRQEAFRKAWECLPICYIQPKAVPTHEIAIETDDIVEKQELIKQNNKKLSTETLPKLSKNQRRAQGKFVPIPLPTLAVVQEGQSEIYLLHDAFDLLIPGDLIRIGHHESRDYIVSVVGINTLSGQFPKAIKIDPEYDLFSEPDFSTPIYKNNPWPNNAGVYSSNFSHYEMLLRHRSELGYQYDLPSTMTAFLTIKDKDNNNSINNFKSIEYIFETNLALTLPNILTEKASNTKIKKQELTVSSSTSSLPIKSSQMAKIYMDVWLWKLIPAKDDLRYRWRQDYDNGLVNYSYEFTHSDESIEHFRITVSYRYLEILCTDSRLPFLSHHQQRVNLFPNLNLDYFLKLIFDFMVNWAPAYSKGVDRSKCLKLLRHVEAFPDLGRAARVAQIEGHFDRIVNNETLGIMNRYLTLPGFVRFIKEISVIRFPPMKRKKENIDDFPDDASVESTLTTATEKKNLTIGQRKALSNKKKDKKEEITLDGEEYFNTFESDDLNNTFNKFVLNYLMTYPGFYDLAWKDAKIMAIKLEGLFYTAATRIQSIVRGFIFGRRYKKFLKNIIILQSHIRRKQHHKYVKNIIISLHNDWIYRLRYFSAVTIQSLIRKFLKKCWYYNVKDQLKKQQVIIIKARCQKKRNIKNSKFTSLLYVEGKKINGIMVIIKVYRKDSRNYTRDYGIIIQVYVPQSQATFYFLVENDEYRVYMAMALNVKEVTIGDLLSRTNIETFLAERLIVHKPSVRNSAPLIVFSKHALGQRGTNRCTHAKKIQGEMFICKIFEAVDELTVQLYHTYSCKIFTATISHIDLRKWLIDENILEVQRQKRLKRLEKLKLAQEGESGGEAEGVECDLENVEPPLLLPENQMNLFAWLLDHLSIDTRNGQFRILFSMYLETSRKKEMIVKIQAVWRRALVRPRIIQLLDETLLIVKSSYHEDAPHYYLNLYDGTSTWTKPKLLGRYELPTRPTRRWVPFYYYDKGQWKTSYVNPWSGKYTNLTPCEGAKKIQNLVRKFFLKPISMTTADFIKAGKLWLNAGFNYYNIGGEVVPPIPPNLSPDERDNEEIPAVKYNKLYNLCGARFRANKKDISGNKKLAASINFAIINQIVEYDEISAKKLYSECVELSESNPLVTKCYALFLICTCESPIALNRERAMILLNDSKRKDPNNIMFKIAFTIYQFAVLRQPRNVHALLNLAVAHILIYDNNVLGERILRRALSISPFDERLLEVWKYLQPRFPEKKLLYNPSSRINQARKKQDTKRIIHGYPVLEDSQWAGWCYVEFDEYQVSKNFKNLPFWYNPADGTETLETPDFHLQWEIRKARSVFKSDANGLMTYYDPLTSEYFEYHPLSNTYSS